MDVNKLPIIKYYRARRARMREQERAQQALRRFSEIYIGERPVDLARFGEFRSEAFPACGPFCWLDQPNALREIGRKRRSGEITAAEADICERWTIDGYFVAEGLISRERIDEVWRAYETALAGGVIETNHESLGEDDTLPGRNLDAHLAVPEIKELQRDEEILRIANLLFGRPTLPFQTIIGYKGSSQSAHSDHIHMTTYPLGWLLACWIALEDIHEDSGPLEFYPRSHRLAPLLLSRDVEIAPYEYKASHGVAYHERYEPTIRDYIDRMQLRPEVFLPKAGDALFWHANLLHGGSTRRNLTLSRKALVCHYFAEGVVTYHDLSGNPSRLHRNGWMNPPAAD